MTSRSLSPRVHIVGRKNAGKTTLVCELVAALSEAGYRVATVKHTHHHHELDTPGKDSYRHRAAGAAVVGILSPDLAAAFVPVERSPDEAERYRPLEPLLAECQLVLVEGDLQATCPRIEVWRQAVGEPPYATSDPGIVAVISDDAPDVPCPVIRRADPDAIRSAVLQASGLAFDSNSALGDGDREDAPHTRPEPGSTPE